MSKFNLKDIGPRVRAARDAVDITQDKLAELLEVSNSTMTNIERNIHEPKITQLVKIAEITGVKLTELVYGKDYEEDDDDLEVDVYRLIGDLKKVNKAQQEIIIEILEGLINNARTKMRYQREKKPIRA